MNNVDTEQKRVTHENQENEAAVSNGCLPTEELFKLHSKRFSYGGSNGLPGNYAGGLEEHHWGQMAKGEDEE